MPEEQHLQLGVFPVPPGARIATMSQPAIKSANKRTYYKRVLPEPSIAFSSAEGEHQHSQKAHLTPWGIYTNHHRYMSTRIPLSQVLVRVFPCPVTFNYTNHKLTNKQLTPLSWAAVRRTPCVWGACIGLSHMAHTFKRVLFCCRAQDIHRGAARRPRKWLFQAHGAVHVSLGRWPAL